jgi:RNA polymerase sigma-70 factor (ECF subfamily)
MRNEMPVNSEWQYFIRARGGDDVAWRALVGRYRTRLTALALLITGSADSAHDVVQETFLRAFRAEINNFKGSVRGYLGTIAYRLALKEIKQEKRKIQLEGQNLIDERHNPLDHILENERDRQIAETIKSLDPEHRDVLTLRFYGGYSYDEIARLLQIPIGTVKSRIFYAVKTCREILKKKGVLL